MSAQSQPYPTRLQASQGLDPRTRQQVALANQQYQQRQQQQQQQQHYYLPPEPLVAQPPVLRDPDDGMPATSEFVRKLYRMLAEPEFAPIVCWGTQGDCFIVKDMTEFTKVILPRLFKHSNFASFVRQLNKYDFHKVKNTDENAYGEHCWTFRHPKFRIHDLEGMENIKRKSAPMRKSTGGGGGGGGGGGRATAQSQTAVVPHQQQQQHEATNSDSPSSVPDSSAIHEMQNHINQLVTTQEDMKAHINKLEGDYRRVLDEMVNMHRTMSTQDTLIQTLLSNFLNDPLGRSKGSPNAFVAQDEAQRLIGSSYNSDELARQSLQSLTQMSQRQSQFLQNGTQSYANGTLIPANGSRSGSQPVMGPPRPEDLMNLAFPQSQPSQQQQQSPPSVDLQAQSSAVQRSSSAVDWFAHEGLEVLTVGHIMPRVPSDSPVEIYAPAGASVSNATNNNADLEVEEQVMPTGVPQPAVNSNGVVGGPRLRVRRKTYVPGWAVPPRVLLVEDDAVSRKLGGKFLEVLGVTADFAVDGESAVKQMHLGNYDLVLMDIVMPKLDGVSATSLIRQFDHRTPIISMTSNSCPQDILNYYSHGMNDILPKPFTRDGLLGMLEKHLMHLKAIQQMTTVPRAIGAPGDGGASTTTPATTVGSDMAASSASFKAEDASTTAGTSPFDFASATMMPDEQYNALLNMTMGMSDLFGAGAPTPSAATASRLGIKRTASELDDGFGGEDGHSSKRGRFEVVE